MRLVSHQNVNCALKTPFRISRGAKTEARLVRVEIRQRDFVGLGECCPYPRYGESQESVLEAIEGVKKEVETGLSIASLQALLPPGAARNALDCALYDLEAKMTKIPVWKRLGLAKPKPFKTLRTISIDTPEAMAAAAKAYPKGAPLKIKLDGEGIETRLRAIRGAAPESEIMVDANEGWTAEILDRAMPVLKGFGVKVLEQPLPAGQDEDLRHIKRLVSVLADEACHTANDLEALSGKYDAVNIKLDKTGGLTGALELLRGAKKAGFKIMLGSMVSSSLSVAPIALLCSDADFIDLDAPLFLKVDPEGGIREIPGTPEVEITHPWGQG